MIILLVCVFGWQEYCLRLNSISGRNLILLPNRFWERFGRILKPLNLHYFRPSPQCFSEDGWPGEDYLTERLTEAEIIETLYRPIKISAVGRHKDDGVDGNLPVSTFARAPLGAVVSPKRAKLVSESIKEMRENLVSVKGDENEKFLE